MLTEVATGGKRAASALPHVAAHARLQQPCAALLAFLDDAAPAEVGDGLRRRVEQLGKLARRDCRFAIGHANESRATRQASQSARP
jgi:hypothetical protein